MSNHKEGGRKPRRAVALKTLKRGNSKPPTPKPLNSATIVASGGGLRDAGTGAIVPPIHWSTTFVRDADNGYSRGFCYGRADNPTARHVESVLAALEGGHSALTFASGMAAATTALLALERPGHIVASNTIYWGLRRWLLDEASSHGLEPTFVDTANPEQLAQALRPGKTRMVWIETPSNPTCAVTDIAAAADAAHGGGALLGVDSTVPTPILTQPFKYGADIILHSATKYLNGHSDVVAGAIVFATPGHFADRCTVLRGSFGGILGAFEAALLLRGMRTLSVRVRQQSASALAIAKHLAKHRLVSHVLYPGLPSHPGHDIAKRQMHGGFGGMLAIRLGSGEDAIACAANLKLWQRATSLGGVESLIEHRASMEGIDSDCPADLLRLSVGLEDVRDLIDDLEQALSAID